MAPMLMRLLGGGHEKQMGPLMPIAEVPAIVGMLLFLTNITLELASGAGVPGPSPGLSRERSRRASSAGPGPGAY